MHFWIIGNALSDYYMKIAGANLVDTPMHLQIIFCETIIKALG